MADEAGDKKHEATPYRRQKAREEGQLARSQDLSSAVLLMVALAVLQSTGPGLLEAVSQVLRYQLQAADYWNNDPRQIIQSLTRVTMQVGWSLFPLLGGVFATAILVQLSQTGLLFLPGKLAVDWNHVNPLQGVARLFSITNATRLGFGLLKILLVAIVLLLGVWNRWNQIVSLSSLPIEAVAGFFWESSLDLSLQAGFALLVLALADFGFQKWKYEQDLMMTDEEIREEMKMTQGDPSTKARRRRVQRELANQRLQADVPKADVVVTNPTELAVALKYDPETMKAPIVVAKGADLVAARIRKIALEAGVPIVERKPLAQALFKSVEVGRPVPVQEYAAVAEVLKFVYQVQGRSIPSSLKNAA
jgi:flagellar biosynthetic protein FlhB